MDTSRFATKWMLTFVAAVLGGAIVTNIWVNRQLLGRVESLEWLQRVDSRYLAEQGCKVDAIEREWPSCCSPPIQSRAKLEAEALQRWSAENAVRGAIKSIEDAGYSLDDMPEHPAAPWPDKPSSPNEEPWHPLAEPYVKPEIEALDE